ncbi:ATP-binding protein [Roseivivax sp. CAU 1753]
MWFLLRVLSVTVFAIGLAVEASSDEADRTLRVGHNEFHPFVFTDESNQPVGYSIDLITLLSKRAGYELEFVPSTGLGHMLELLERGEVDVLPILAETPERKNLARFTKSIGRFTNNLIVLKDSEITDHAVISGKRIGFVRSSGAARTAASLDDVVLMGFDTQSEMLVALLAGRVDGVVAATEAFMSLLKAVRDDHRVTILEPALSDRPRGFLVRRDLQQVVADLDQAIAENFSPAEAQNLHEKWFGIADLGRPKLGAHWILIGCAAFGIAITSISVSIRNRRRAKQLEQELAVVEHMADALENLDILVTIYDEEMRPIYWNDLCKLYASEQVALLRERRSFVEILAQSRINGVFLPKLTRDEANRHAREIADRVRDGEVVRRILKTQDGRTYDVCDARVAPSIYASVRSDISLIAEQGDIIEAQKAELEERNTQLEGFVNIAAHDLRAPLRHASMSARWLKEDLAHQYGTLTDDLVDTFDTIEQSSQRMTRLIDDLLTFALVGKAAGRPTEFELEQAVAHSIELTGLPETAQVTQLLDVAVIEVDQTAFEVVLRNLVSNAVKHHDKEEVHLLIRAYRKEGVVVVEVEDDGPGIPEMFHDRIFKEFEKLKPKDVVEGSGLGLSFVQKTVNAWGGTVSVANCGARGSVFRFTIPEGKGHMGRDTGRAAA